MRPGSRQKFRGFGISLSAGVIIIIIIIVILFAQQYNSTRILHCRLTNYELLR